MTAPTPYSRFYMPFAYAADDTGAPASGDKLYFYESGTSTPLDTYADDTLSIPNENPVRADQGGNFPAIFLAQAQYKVVRVRADGTEVWNADPVAPFIPADVTEPTTVVIECTVDGNSQVPAAGVCADLYVPFACTITQAVLQADEPGDLVVDVWAAPFVVNTPPNATNSITASDPPELSSSVSSSDSTLTGWTVNIPANTALRFNIVSIDTITRFTLTLVAARV